MAVSPFILFFGFDSAAIDDRAAAILDNVAVQVRHLEVPRLVIAGHTDRAGPSDYNRTLSRRRAEAVRDYLRRRGLSRVAIEIEAFGEERPAVETSDGAAEIQNRRVEVAIGCIPRPGPGFEYMRC